LFRGHVASALIGPVGPGTHAIRVFSPTLVTVPFGLLRPASRPVSFINGNRQAITETRKSKRHRFIAIRPYLGLPFDEISYPCAHKCGGTACDIFALVFHRRRRAKQSKRASVMSVAQAPKSPPRKLALRWCSCANKHERTYCRIAKKRCRMPWRFGD
jgi:hypothetical protein